MNATFLRSPRLAAVIAALLLAPALPAHAAQGDALRVPPIYPRDLVLVDRMLSLDEAQRPIVEALMDELAAAPEGDIQASRQFMEYLAAVLTPGQVALLDEACAALRSERLEASARIAGENIEVSALVDRTLRGERDAALTRILENYGNALDAIMASRDWSALGRTEDADTHAVRVRLRDLNDRTIAEIAGALPPAARERFRDQAVLAGYPAACAPQEGLRLLAALRAAMPSSALEGLEAAAREKAPGIRDRAVDAVRARDGAQFSGDGARASASAAIAAAERELEEFDRWFYPAVLAEVSMDDLQRTEEGRAMVRRAQFDAQVAAVKWGDQSDTLRAFDKDGNGELDGDEASRMMEAFSKSVGRRSRWKL